MRSFRHKVASPKFFWWPRVNYDERVVRSFPLRPLFLGRYVELIVGGGHYRINVSMVVFSGLWWLVNEFNSACRTNHQEWHFWTKDNSHKLVVWSSIVGYGISESSVGWVGLRHWSDSVVTLCGVCVIVVVAAKSVVHATSVARHFSPLSASQSERNCVFQF